MYFSDSNGLVRGLTSCLFAHLARLLPLWLLLCYIFIGSSSQTMNQQPGIADTPTRTQQHHALSVRTCLLPVVCRFLLVVGVASQRVRDVRQTNMLVVALLFDQIHFFSPQISFFIAFLLYCDSCGYRETGNVGNRERRCGGWPRLDI